VYPCFDKKLQSTRIFTFLDIINLSGEAVIEVDGERQALQAQQEIEIPHGVAHQFRNESNLEVIFLVISVPKSHRDRVEI